MPEPVPLFPADRANLAVFNRFNGETPMGRIATPQEIRVVERVPKNKSGKIMRRVLRAGYLGLDAGDISTLEDE